MAIKEKRAALAALIGLGLLFAAPAPAQEAENVVVFGDWERVCTDEGRCTFSQANADPETGDIRMRTEISALSDTQTLLSVIVPDSVLLTEGPWLTVDGLYVGELNYVRCPGGCLARMVFTPQQFQLVAGGTRAVITVTAGGQRVGLVISMDGLQTGLAAFTDF